MKIRYRGHNYKTQFRVVIRDFFNEPVTHPRNTIWFSHGDDCCDYWTPINDPKAQRAIMLDDDLGLRREG